MDWLKIMMMTRHHRTWGERAFWYVIAGKRFKTFLSHTWLGRNFDFTALFVISIPALIWFFDPLSGYWTIRSFVEYNTLLVGALLGFPILIKRVDTNQETLKEAQKQTRTSQYRDARDLLQSNQLNSRMMGIADLWRFARTHPQDEYHSVMDVFINFIHQPIPYEWEEGTKEEDKKAGKRKDIAAILKHIGEKRMAEAEPYWIDLRHAHLEGADLAFAYLEKGAFLDYVHLEGAVLEGANLERVNLSWAHLEGACLLGANLKGAVLAFAHLEGTDLDGAHLEEANLKLAHLDGARLDGARLGGADLDDATLKLAVITNTDFSRANGLTQEQINSCIFTKNFSFYEPPPSMPEGIEPPPQIEMAYEEWLIAIEQAGIPHNHPHLRF